MRGKLHTAYKQIIVVMGEIEAEDHEQFMDVWFFREKPEDAEKELSYKPDKPFRVIAYNGFDINAVMFKIRAFRNDYPQAPVQIKRIRK